jgi:hypothetical protein
MGKVIKLSDYVMNWRQIFATDSDNSTLQIYVNERTGEFEIVQMNDDGEVIRTCLSTVESVGLSQTMTAAHKKLCEK